MGETDQLKRNHEKVGWKYRARRGIWLATALRSVDDGPYVFTTGRRQTEVDAAVGTIGGNGTGVQKDAVNQGYLDRIYEEVRCKEAISISYSLTRKLRP